MLFKLKWIFLLLLCLTISKGQEFENFTVIIKGPVIEIPHAETIKVDLPSEVKAEGFLFLDKISDGYIGVNIPAKEWWYLSDENPSKLQKRTNYEKLLSLHAEQVHLLYFDANRTGEVILTGNSYIALVPHFGEPVKYRNIYGTTASHIGESTIATLGWNRYQEIFLAIRDFNFCETRNHILSDILPLSEDISPAMFQVSNYQDSWLIQPFDSDQVLLESKDKLTLYKLKIDSEVLDSMFWAADSMTWSRNFMDQQAFYLTLIDESSRLRVVVVSRQNFSNTTVYQPQMPEGKLVSLTYSTSEGQVCPCLFIATISNGTLSITVYQIE